MSALSSKRRKSGHAESSGSGQKRPSLRCSNSLLSRLLDHLVGNADESGRDRDAECPRRRQIDDKLKLGGLLDREVGGLGALENPAGILADLTIHVRDVGAVAHQSAGFDKVAADMGSRYHVARRKRGKLDPPAVEDPVRSGEKRIGPHPCEALKGCVDLGDARGFEDLDVKPKRTRGLPSVAKRGF